jgi:hypothetical protein
MNPPQTNLTEGILDISRAIEKERHERPVIVLSRSRRAGGWRLANEVLNQLRQSGAMSGGRSCPDGAGRGRVGG